MFGFVFYHIVNPNQETFWIIKQLVPGMIICTLRKNVDSLQLGLGNLALNSVVHEAKWVTLYYLEFTISSQSVPALSFHLYVSFLILHGSLGTYS